MLLCADYCHRKWLRWREFKTLTRRLAFLVALIYVQKAWIQLYSLQLLVNSRGYRSQMTRLLTWLPPWIFWVKASQLCLPHFLGERLMQQVGCSVVPGWPAQHICMSGVYSPIHSSSKWQQGSFSTCVSDHSQVNQYFSGLTCYLALVRQKNWEKENSELKPVKLWPCVTSCLCGNFGKYSSSRHIFKDVAQS